MRKARPPSAGNLFRRPCAQKETPEFLRSLSDYRKSVSVTDLNDLLLVVRPAVPADVMRHHELAALRALDEIHGAHLPVRSSLVSVASGRFILRANRHPETPPYLDVFNGQRPCKNPETA